MYCTDGGCFYTNSDIIYTGESRGSDSLAAKVSQLQIPLHIFGHNHEGYGAENDDTTTYINAATCVGGAKSAARRQAIVVDYYPSLKQFYHV
jgi:Icc-related predicted phosphoesterase